MVADHTEEGTTGAGGKMVFVKVRETYDLCTVKNKMTVISIHTPNPDIIKRNYPGLLLQCRAYRPYSVDVRLACASVLPLDPQGVGTDTGDVAPEDMFNPILYKAMSNFGMSQLEARINHLAHGTSMTADAEGPSAQVETDELTNIADEFPVYYGLLSDTNGWKHAMPQQGLSMNSVKPLVWEMLYNVGDTMQIHGSSGGGDGYFYPGDDSSVKQGVATAIRGNSKPMPMIPTGVYSSGGNLPGYSVAGDAGAGAQANEFPYARFNEVPWLNVVCAAVIVPPSRLHTLYYRMVVEWTIEFSSIRSLGEIVTFGGLANIGASTHFQNYNYLDTKSALTGSDETILENDTCMVSSNVEVNKVM